MFSFVTESIGMRTKCLKSASSFITVKLLAKSKNADKFKARMDKLYDKVEKAADSLGVPVKGVKGFAEFDKVYDDLFRVEDEVRSM